MTKRTGAMSTPMTAIGSPRGISRWRTVLATSSGLVVDMGLSYERLRRGGAHDVGDRAGRDAVAGHDHGLRCAPHGVLGDEGAVEHGRIAVGQFASLLERAREDAEPA